MQMRPAGERTAITVIPGRSVPTISAFLDFAAAEVFGAEPLPGVLVVDRYNGYNKMPCSIQYCYAHLLREVKDLEKNFPEYKEYRETVGWIGRTVKKQDNIL